MRGRRSRHGRVLLLLLVGRLLCGLPILLRLVAPCRAAVLLLAKRRLLAILLVAARSGGGASRVAGISGRGGSCAVAAAAAAAAAHLLVPLGNACTALCRGLAPRAAAVAAAAAGVALQCGRGAWVYGVSM